MMVSLHYCINIFVFLFNVSIKLHDTGYSSENTANTLHLDGRW